ncbi:MAG TPA: DUF1850 domain-containing protein [Syntrophomonadaceae bacterium]|jgi:hypothetical protein|nr:DUF1850 domain-containing protein [Syntrophomonadaceae bacterium]HRX21399.1 DUF1850 domain-containing protein [Syntrophomonadaceae bacterium]
MISRQWYIITGVVILIIVLLLLISVPTLVLSKQDGTIGLLVPLFKEKEFTVEYLHSVNKTPVQEHFVPAPDNKIVLIETEFRSLGVGTPFLPEEGQLVNDQGVYRLSGMDRSFEKISYVPLAFTRHTLLAEGKKFLFSNYFADGQIAVVKIEKCTLIQLIQYQFRKGS